LDLQASCTSVQLGLYGAPTRKCAPRFQQASLLCTFSFVVLFRPIHIFSNSSWAAKLHKKQPQKRRTYKVKIVDRYTDSSGKCRIKGNRHLKSSAKYPSRFGAMIAKLVSSDPEINKTRKIASTSIPTIEVPNPVFTLESQSHV
jgi:hypothetical protein